MALLLTRGVLLWLVVPLGCVIWVLTVVVLHRPLGQFLGWLDLNLIWALQRTILKPVFRTPTQARIAVRDIGTVTHRIGILDPA